jgi:uncharacterized membrane protein
MVYFLLGLIGFLALHSLRVLAPQWRDARVAAWGEQRWKIGYSLLSIALFVLLVWGFSHARQSPDLLWAPPAGMRHAGMLLTLAAFVLLVAAYVPRNHLRIWLRHPMTLGVALWAVAHLMMTGWLHSVLLAAGFLLWAIVLYLSARRRPAFRATVASPIATIATLVIGAGLWAAFALHLHRILIGVALF